MHHTFCLSFYKSRSNCLSFVVLILLVFSSLGASAQRRKDPWNTYGGGSNGSVDESGYALSLSSYYDTPSGDLAPTFNPAIGFSFSVLRFSGSFTFNASIGYHAYNPRQDIFTYDDGSGGTGTIVWQSFPVYSFYTGAVYNLPLGGASRLYGGVNIGVYYTTYAYQSADQFSTSDVDLNEEDLYFAPKVGFAIGVTDNIRLGIEGRYNFFSPEGSSASNPDVGVVYKSYAVGFVLSYKL
jgi:hypothetical protein